MLPETTKTSQKQDKHTPIFEARDLRKSYGDYPVLRDLNCEGAPGEFLAIMGDSGSGKSTFLNLLAGLDRADEGVLRVGDVEPSQLEPDELQRYRREYVGIIFQDFNLLSTLTALENVVLPMQLRGEKPDGDFARLCLERVGLGEKLNRLPEALSGGEMQRVGIARALALRPRLLLADEPTGNLDRGNSREVMELLRDINRGESDAPGPAIVMVTHSSTAAASASRTLVMEDGRLRQ